MFRSVIVLCLIAFAVSASTAQTAYKSSKAGWEVEMAKAVKMSKESGKPILANFTGTDWCGWGIRLDKSVFSKPDFKQWAEENVVLLELDFPKRTRLPDDIRKQNSELQRAFQVSGFPTVWVFNADKDPETNGFSIQALGKTGYAKSVSEFTSAVDQMLAKGSK